MPVDKAMSGDIKGIILVAILAMFGGGGGSWLQQRYSGPPEIPNRFTDIDFAREKREIQDHYDKRLIEAVDSMKTFVVAAMELQKRDLELTISKVEQDIREKLPPEATRSRIRAIEGFLKNQHDYQPPTYDWH